jgi:hypothetical protein
LFGITQNQLGHKLIPKIPHQIFFLKQLPSIVYVHVQQDLLAQLLDAKLVEVLEVLFVFGDQLLQLLEEGLLEREG